MLNPYAHIDWSSVSRVASATHMHMTNQEALDNGWRHGIRHFPISNYYPSAPYRADTRPSDFRLCQHWPARFTNGGSLEPPIDWNEIITWRDELEEPYRSQLPFTEGDRAFSTIPEGAILSPNAEHHGFSNSRAHICCPGSTFISGNIDPQGDKFGLKAHGYCVGFGGTWQEGLEAMIGHLKYPDAGGVTINHPTWFSQFTDDEVTEMLDFDCRILGIEIYNDYSARRDWFGTQIAGYRVPDEPEPGFSLSMWDRILSTARRCWGFSVPDHSVETGVDWRGRNVLLVSDVSEHECLKAYREGRFYGCLKDNGLTILDLTASDSSVSVRTNGASEIAFITEAGRVRTVTGDEATYEPSRGTDVSAPVFVRVEIADASGERLFLQPLLYQVRKHAARGRVGEQE